MILVSPTVKRFFPVVFTANNLYLFWLSFHINWNAAGIAFWIAEFLAWLLTLFFFFNHYEQEHQNYGSRRKFRDATVDIFIPVVNEPKEILGMTIKAAQDIDYNNKEIYLLDDSGRRFYEDIARQYSLRYIPREERRDAKAGNLNNALKCSSGEFILVFDADQVAEPSILKQCMGYFNDDEVAFVTTRQRFDVPPNDFNHDHLFYGHMQPGKHLQRCAISCGSGVIYRRSAIDEIGGFQNWNIIEDLTTSFVLHSRGYDSVYVSRAYSIGTAPQDLPNIYKQRVTWALDTLRILFRRNLIFNRGLGFRRMLHYLEICHAYIVAGLVLPILYLIPVYSLFTNEAVISVSQPLVYAILKTLAITSLLTMYFFLCRGFQNAQYWAGLFPVYFKALVLSLLPGKPKYKVTVKGLENDVFAPHLVLPQLLLLAATVVGIIYHLHFYGAGPISYANFVWITLTFYWLSPVILHGLNLHRKSYTS